MKYVEMLEPIQKAEALETGSNYHSLLEELNKTGNFESDYSKESAMATAYKKYIYPHFKVTEAEKYVEYDLGKLCGLAGVTICNVENGSNPSKMTRIKIELALKKGEVENEVVNQQDKNIQVMQENVPTEICGESGTDTESGSTGDGQ